MIEMAILSVLHACGAFNAEVGRGMFGEKEKSVAALGGGYQCCNIVER